MNNLECSLLEKELEQDLLRTFGPMMFGKDLIRALGYVSKEAFRQSVVRKTVQVPLFEIPHRRGKFALVKDVAKFLARQRIALEETNSCSEENIGGAVNEEAMK